MQDDVDMAEAQVDQALDDGGGTFNKSSYDNFRSEWSQGVYEPEAKAMRGSFSKLSEDREWKNEADGDKEEPTDGKANGFAAAWLAQREATYDADDTVTMFRGITATEGTNNKGRTDVDVNVLSSWTSSREVADAWGGSVVQADIPRADILGPAFTGDVSGFEEFNSIDGGMGEFIVYTPTPTRTTVVDTNVIKNIMAGLEVAYADKADTQNMFDHVDGHPGQYTPERAAMHAEIVDEILGRPEIKSDGQMVIMGGLPGAGKTTFINSDQGQAALGLDVNEYVTLNPDDIKAIMAERGMIPDYSKYSGIDSPNEATGLTHEESADITSLIARRASREGKNILWDITMSSEKSVAKRLDQAIENIGNEYSVRMVYIDTDPATAAKRALMRYQRGGRFVPPDFIASIPIDDQGRSQNRRVFDALRGRAAESYLVDRDLNIVGG